ncbi:MAG: transcription antitermination factor NusB [bacterium]
MGRRREARIIAFSAIYESELTKRNMAEILVDDVIKLLDKDVRSDIRNYAVQLVRKALENKKIIEEKIEENLTNRSYEQILPLEKALLFTGVTEMLFFPDVPYLTVIDEIIEIAKEYGGISSSKFVNGVLNAIYKELMDEDSGIVGHS